MSSSQFKLGREGDLKNPTLTLSTLAHSHHLPNPVGDDQQTIVHAVQLIGGGHGILVPNLAQVICVVDLPYHQLVFLHFKETRREISAIPILGHLLPWHSRLPKILHLAILWIAKDRKS